MGYSHGEYQAFHKCVKVWGIYAKFKLKNWCLCDNTEVLANQINIMFQYSTHTQSIELKKYHLAR